MFSILRRCPWYRVAIVGMVLATGLSNGRAAQSPLADLSDAPISDWLDAGEVEEVRWDIDVLDPRLRMDQRIEVVVRGSVRGRDLEPVGAERDLGLWIDVRRREDGSPVAESGLIRHNVEAGLPENANVEFDIKVFVTPGDYTFSVLLVDQATGRRSVEVDRVEVDEVNDEPFPDAWADIPAIQFPDMDWADDDDEVEPGAGDLIMPLTSRRHLDIEVISGLSVPEQFDSMGAARRHGDNMRDVLIAASQFDVADGTLSFSGLDLVRRMPVFEELKSIDYDQLEEAIDQTNAGLISLDDLANRQDNPHYFSRFVEQRLAGHLSDPTAGDPLKVLIFLMGVTRFDDDADVEEMTLEGDCDCVAFHVRIRQANQDLFDQIDDILDPLDPESFNVLTPEDLRRAFGRIARDLSRY